MTNELETRFPYIATLRNPLCDDIRIHCFASCPQDVIDYVGVFCWRVVDIRQCYGFVPADVQFITILDND